MWNGFNTDVQAIQSAAPDCKEWQRKCKSKMKGARCHRLFIDARRIVCVLDVHKLRVVFHSLDEPMKERNQWTVADISESLTSMTMVMPVHEESKPMKTLNTRIDCHTVK
ncbi:conserved hypothetical protein [Ricinus communis]|uniref:Uncharacterized protein n=1 Tax=Ricinus communis TaxID=3988 RepID=B9SNV3_RICCO|nr:conserved hypothetical protein [Ricinus communis]